MEAGELALYLFLACGFVTLLQHPGSPVQRLIPDGIARRAAMGVAMGTAVTVIVFSPWGKRSGGHFNPALTFAYYRLGKVEFWDLCFYCAAQFLGAIAGVELACLVLSGAPSNHAVNYAVTVPGMYGVTVAFAGELAISFVLMFTVLFVTNREALAPYTAFFVGALVASYYTFESPLSGMSTNPARTVGSAFRADYWHAAWLYFLAPALGMLIAAEVFLRIRRGAPPVCAKLRHCDGKLCIFHHDAPPPELRSGRSQNG